MRRLRLRISISNALLLMAIVGLSIVVARQWREVGPLRAENRRMKAELGFLNIDDPTKAYAMRVDTPAGEPYKWRVYLPPGGKYELNCYTGHPLPTDKKLKVQDFLDSVKLRGSGFTSHVSKLRGEFTLEARLTKEGDVWKLYAKPGGATEIYASAANIADGGPVGFTSNVSLTDQTEFDVGEPILLMQMVKPVITQLPDGNWTSQIPKGPADGFALWIEEYPRRTPPTPAPSRPAPLAK